MTDIPECLSSENDLFKAIQNLFLRDKGHISYLGEYCMPEEPVSEFNDVELLAHQKNDHAIVNSHHDHIWRVTAH